MDLGISSTSSAYTSAVNTTAQAPETSAKNVEDASKKGSESVAYEKSNDTGKKATYSINKMSKEERSALVQQLKDDQVSRQQSLLDIVNKTLGQQATKFTLANLTSEDDDSIWKKFANGEFKVDEATRKQAEEDISEDGYWGVKQTSQRLFDFASALAGDDVDKMKEMQAAVEKGYKQATKAWGKDLPDISRDTLSATNKLFDEYYKSKEQANGVTA